MHQRCTNRCTCEAEGLTIQGLPAWPKLAMDQAGHTAWTGLWCWASSSTHACCMATPLSAAVLHRLRSVTDEPRLSSHFAGEQGVLPAAASCSRRQVRRCPSQPFTAKLQCPVPPQTAGQAP